uniref:DNA 3'-5' helicase n=1 Tax=candidate division CPR3 bacterium TaxID=2268181 RepID=A0A7C4M043_UNCC3
MQTKDILEELNDAQKEAVQYNDGPLMVVAGAGTGKTRVIISKVAYLIAEKLAKPSEILAITFTKKAASEMEERLDIVLPYGYNDVKACNFHSLAEEFLRENAYSLGYSTNFKIMTQPQQILFVRDRIFDFNLKIFRPLGDPTYFIKDMLSHFSRLKDELISPDDYIQFAKELENKADSGAGDNPSTVAQDLQTSVEDRVLREYAAEHLELAHAYKTYQEMMAMADRMDFGDLIFNMVKALKEKEQLLAGFRKKYKYILVDEFQDTNYGQNELLKILTLNEKKNPTNPTHSTNPTTPIITVVGDDDQSIYKFRGAAISNILDFKESWGNVKEVVLTQNYRNTQEILDSSYKLIQNNNPDRLEAKYGINKKLNSNTEKGVKPQLLVFDNATEEAAAIANEISNLKSQILNLKYSDFAILVRSNNIAMPFINALASKKIPHLFSGNEGLFRKSVIKNIIAFLSILVNPYDNFALFNLLVGEFVGVDFDRLSIVLHKVRSKNIPLEEYLRESKGEDLDKDLGKDNLKKIEDILNIIENIRRESIQLSAGEILYRFVSDSGYLKKLATEEKAGDILSGEKIVSIAGFFDKILSFQDANMDVGIQKFMEYLNLLLEIGEDPKDEVNDPTYDAVRILTVHAAKGLEFKYVFMVGLSDSKFPSRNHGEVIKFPVELLKEGDSESDPKVLHIQEERRLFYVGMTRAQERLYFTFGKDYGGKKSVKISRFVADSLGQENIDPQYFKQSQIERIEYFAPKENVLYSTRLKLKEGKLKLSRAEVDDYITCPRKYKFIHITPIKMMTDPRVIFGRSIHKVIEEYYRFLLKQKSIISNSQFSISNDGAPQAQILKLEQLLEIYQQNWSSEGFLSAEHEKKRYDEGIEVIKRFYAEYADKINVVEVEKPFRFEIGENIIDGRIDAIEKLDDGGVRIIDFKTSEIGSEDDANKRAKDNTQLSVYALALKELTGELPREVGLFFLMSGHIGTFVPTETIIEKTKEKIAKASMGIRAQEFTATPDKRTCEMCPFNRYCDDSAV